MNYLPRHSCATPARVKAVRAAAAGVATAVVSGGLAVASTGSANAAGSVWDRVAACESGGNWSINTGNGFYGGLQFTRQTWLGFGGGAYASSAQYASKAQQIAIAQRVLKVQGPGAWPVCSRKAGLTRSNGGAAATVTVSRSTTRTAVKATSTVKNSSVVTIQRKVKVAQTGVLDRTTIRAIQRFVGTPADGVIGPKTVRAMERKAGLRASGSSRLTSATLAGFAKYCAR